MLSNSNVSLKSHAVYNAHGGEVKLGPSKALFTVHNEYADTRLAIGSTVDICYKVLCEYLCVVSSTLHYSAMASSVLPCVLIYPILFVAMLIEYKIHPIS